MSKVYRVFVEKRKDYAVEAVELLHNIKHQLKITGLEDIKVVNRYDVQGVSVEALNEGINIILSEPMVDDVLLENYPTTNEIVFAIEYLPGQYDQRADACEQCFQLLTGEKNVIVKCAKLIVLKGNINELELGKIQKYLINPVDQRLASLDKPVDLSSTAVEIDKVPVADMRATLQAGQRNICPSCLH
jgi:phosphoribosylformylglycinamidine synthase